MRCAGSSGRNALSASERTRKLPHPKRPVRWFGGVGVVSLGIAVLLLAAPSAAGKATSIRVVSSVDVLGPSGSVAVFNPFNHDTYMVVNDPRPPYSTNVTVIGLKNTVVANLPLAGEPSVPSLTYDPSSHDVYVCDNTDNLVLVLSGSTTRVLARLNLGSPYASVYDPQNQQVYVAAASFQFGGTESDAQVYALNGTHRVATIDVGNTPESIVYSPATHDLYTANYASSNVSVISGSSERLIKTIPAPPFNQSQPSAVYYSASTHDVLLVDAIDQSHPWAIQVISPANRIVKEIPMPGTSKPFLVFDPQSGEEYVLLGFDLRVLVLSPTFQIAGTISLPDAAESATYDPDNHDVYVASNHSTQGFVFVISTSTNKLIPKFPWG